MAAATLATMGAATLALASMSNLSSGQESARLRAPIVATLRSDLRGDDPTRIAWAAHDAGELRLGELVPDLVSVLERAPGRDLGPLDPAELEQWRSALVPPPPRDPRFDDPRHLHRFVPGVVLDALTRLDAAAPPGFVERALLLPSRPARRSPDPFEFFAGAFSPALVLFAQHGSEYQEVVDKVMALTATKAITPTDIRSWIAADWCATYEPKKLVTTLIDLPTWSVSIEVFEHDLTRFITRCGGAWSPSAPPPWPDRFPPAMVHELRAKPTTGALCLFDQPVPLFWQRRPPDVENERDPRCFDDPFEGLQVAPGDLAVAFLRSAALLKPTIAGVSTRQAFRHEWKSRDELLEFVHEKRREIEAEWSTLVTALAKRGLLDAASATRHPANLEISFVENRGAALRREEPLPPLH